MHAKLYGRGGTAGNIVDIRYFFPDADSSSDVGSGTGWPIGFTIGQIDRIFYNVKKFTFGATGVADAETELQAYPTDGSRHHLFAGKWAHVGSAEGGDGSSAALTLGYNLGGGAVLGKKYAGSYYPFLQVSGSAKIDPEDPDSGFYGYSTAAADYAKGSVSILGKTATIYSSNFDAPAFSADLTVSESWVI